MRRRQSGSDLEQVLAEAGAGDGVRQCELAVKTAAAAVPPLSLIDSDNYMLRSCGLDVAVAAATAARTVARDDDNTPPPSAAAAAPVQPTSCARTLSFHALFCSCHMSCCCMCGSLCSPDCHACFHSMCVRFAASYVCQRGGGGGNGGAGDLLQQQQPATLNHDKVSIYLPTVPTLPTYLHTCI